MLDATVGSVHANVIPGCDTSKFAGTGTRGCANGIPTTWGGEVSLPLPSRAAGSIGAAVSPESGVFAGQSVFGFRGWVFIGDLTKDGEEFISQESVSVASATLIGTALGVRTIGICVTRGSVPHTARK